MEAPPISSVPPTEANAALQQLREGKVHGRMVIDFRTAPTKP
jgi:D-arabinose 1-dehydrogenase-like Zn-dependent alcohol dehydrogenase